MHSLCFRCSTRTCLLKWNYSTVIKDLQLLSPALIISSKLNCSLAILNYWLLDHDNVKCRYNFLWCCIVESTAVLSLLLCGCVRSWCMSVFVDSCAGCARLFFSFMFIWWDASNHNLFISADWLVQPSWHNQPPCKAVWGAVGLCMEHFFLLSGYYG